MSDFSVQVRALYGEFLQIIASGVPCDPHQPLNPQRSAPRARNVRESKAIMESLDNPTLPNSAAAALIGDPAKFGRVD